MNEKEGEATVAVAVYDTFCLSGYVRVLFPCSSKAWDVDELSFNPSIMDSSSLLLRIFHLFVSL